MKKFSDNESIQEWITSNRLYEEYLFYYLLICLFWFFVGLFSIGIRIPVFNDMQNLAFNTVWFLILCVALSIPKFWYFLIKGRHGQLFQAIAKVYETLDSIEDIGQREQVHKQITSNGKLPPNRLETLSLAFLFAFILFDILYTRCWIRDLSLVWQPDWVNACIGWVHNNLSMPPISEDRQIFNLWFDDGHNDTVLKEYFGDEWAFLASPFGDAAMFYHFIRVMMFVPILAALSIVLWKPLKWMGMQQIDPRNIRSVMSFLRSCAWSLIFAFFMAIGTWGFLTNANWFTLGLIDQEAWFDNLYINVLYLFIVFGIRFFYGWLIFWKNIFLKFVKRFSY
ncbi:hypothetical protein QL898_05865 [Psychrobacter sp. APC 3279]|uniref:hypothetical protein n=1 Tax=Psychrobacter sp. APC 3279 TaxID=3035189 RepID=UPI0025B4EADA|nr:hypothetical protein [Psychrobacter sp. APC 3279]MDN3441152.1 hypothetical protein [Psychrobacter sp. APC 3279]